MTTISLMCDLKNDTTYSLEEPIENTLGENWQDKWELINDDVKEIDFENEKVYVKATFEEVKNGG